MSKQFSAACERNAAPILQVLSKALVDCRDVLEIGSGTGQHAIYFAQHLPQLVWHTSDLPASHPSILAWQHEAQLSNVLPPIVLNVQASHWPAGPFDAVFTANTCHIMAWQEVEAMFRGVARVLRHGGLLCVYGPFNIGGSYTSASNAQFDAQLKSQAAHMGIRDIEAICALADINGLQLEEDHAMPANNRLLIWRLA